MGIFLEGSKKELQPLQFLVSVLWTNAAWRKRVRAVERHYWPGTKTLACIVQIRAGTYGDAMCEDLSYA